MSNIVRLLGLDVQRWQRVGPHYLPSAGGIVALASFLFALLRFGGLLTEAPRAFLRLFLVGVWGWLALGLSVAIVVTALRRRRPAAPFLFANGVEALTVAGLAYLPMLFLAVVVFAAGGIIDFLGPGRVMSVFVLVLWMPAVLAVGAHHRLALTPRTAVLAVAGPYLAWLALVGRHLLDRVHHLL